MSSAVYDRLASLLNGYGIALKENDISRAEIMAYANAVDMVCDKLSLVFDCVFLQDDNEIAVSKYLTMLSMDRRDYTLAELKERIIDRLSRVFFTYTESDFEQAFDDIGSGEYSIAGKIIYFRGVDVEDFAALGKFIKSYVCVGTDAKSLGGGYTFDEWDNLGKTFFEMDSWELPFRILNKLGE